LKICFLASGNGGNLKFLYLTEKMGFLKNLNLYIIADRHCGSIDFANVYNIKNRVIKYNKNNNKELLSELKNINADVIITNWHKIIDEQTVKLYEGKMINLHYSLLPSFSGLIGIKPIEKAYEQNCQYVGATCHYVDKGTDTGKIISQTIIKADIEIEYAIQSVFQNACLILLNSIILITNERNNSSLTNNKKFNFSPSLQFSDKMFDRKFWKKVSEL